MFCRGMPEFLLKFEEILLNFEEILSRNHGSSEEQNKVSESPIN
jgi:hypothetical protein